MGLSSTIAIAAGSLVTMEISGAYGRTRNEATFREALAQQLVMCGLAVKSITIQTGGVIENIIGGNILQTPYKVTATVQTMAAYTRLSNLLGLVGQAVENAGSYTPTISVPAIDNVSQPAPQVNAGLLGELAEGLVQAPARLFTSVNLVVVGLVVVVALVAFGPNIKSIAGRARL